MPNDFTPILVMLVVGFATAGFRRLARDVERTPPTLVGLHLLAFLMLMLPRFISTIAHVL